KSVGPWIGPNIAGIVENERPAFVRLLIDGFEQHVLRALKQDARFAAVFDYVDLRGTLTQPQQWFDEMHPTEAGFHALATKFRGVMLGKLPANKR
ncbi:hypothetical protein, partial [Streptomyces coeruleorubidus]